MSLTITFHIQELRENIALLSAENGRLKDRLKYINAEMENAWEQGIVTVDLRNACELDPAPARQKPEMTIDADWLRNKIKNDPEPESCEAGSDSASGRRSLSGGENNKDDL